MPSFPSVSVVIPCFNAGRYVGEAIESVLAQSYEPLEIIVIDDGSTDDSLKIIRSFGHKIDFIATSNRGASAARNTGIEQASGKYLKFLDADDRLIEGAIREQVEFSEQCYDRDAVFGDASYIDESGNVVADRSHRSRRMGENRLEYIMKMNPQTALPLHRRRQLIEIGGFDEELSRAQEYDLHLRLVLTGLEFRYEPTLVAEVRRHPGKFRISNRDHFSENPRMRLSRLQSRETQIASAGLLNDNVKQMLARAAWEGGRRALRRHLSEVAAEYFRYARSTHPDPVPRPGSAYWCCVKLLGPRATERLAAGSRPLRRLFSGNV